MKKISIIPFLAAAACGAQDKQQLDLASPFGVDEGKEDAAKSTKLVDDIAPDSKVEGTFDPRVRVYGYIVDAKRGARLRLSLAATAGADSRDAAKGTALDTIMQIYGPFESVHKPGALLVEHDDAGDSVVPAPIDFEVAQDARYLIVFSSWQDTGTGAYGVSLACDGTDLQCARPDWMRPCMAGTLYIQGGRVDSDTTWETCDIVLLEPTTVAAMKTLTVRPGVVVKGNFLGTAPYGYVRLFVDGTLQAAGTPEHPIAFTSLKEGWGGITLRGPSNTLSNAFVEKAAVAVEVAGSSTLADLVIEGIRPGSDSIGVLADDDVELSLTRSVVKGFRTGLLLGGSPHVQVTQSIVRGNATGILVQGTKPASSCGTAPTPTVWRDPVITNTDIVDNTGNGVTISGSDILLQISRSNIQRNAGDGVSVLGSSLHPMSFLRENNIHSNNKSANNAWEVSTLHRSGTLDLSNNYWIDISDPELSANWLAHCGGTISFTGFSPTPFTNAGPQLDMLSDHVKRAAQN